MKGYQFSLRTLLAAVATVGIGAVLWTAESSWQVGAVEALLLAWVLGSVVALSVHTTGKMKTFWIGVAVESIWPIVVCLPVAVFLSMRGAAESDLSEVPRLLEYLAWWVPVSLIGLSQNFRPILLAWAFAPVVGLLCVLTHWLFIRSADPAEPKD